MNLVIIHDKNESIIHSKHVFYVLHTRRKDKKGPENVSTKTYQ